MSPSNEPNISSERTEQERERAREDRERRRLTKAAAAPPAPIEPPIPPPARPPVAPSPPPVESTPPIGEPTPFVVAPTPPIPPSSTSPPPQPPWSYEALPPSPPATEIPPPRKRAARLAALVALVVVLALLACAAVLVFKPTNHPAPVPPPPKIVKLVIPEGFTRTQIAARAGAEGLRGDYTAASAHSTDLDPTHYGAPRGTHNLEGFLFPATYELYAGESVSRLVSDQLTAFKENFGGYEVHRAHVLGVTPYQLLTVASMVEREAQVPGDSAKIAAVIYNRLHDGMPLGIDATIYYAVEQQQHIATYTGELTESQLHIDSPYNTRLHTGLTPTPISNPGLASIEAAARPAHVPYLYYVAGADGCGEQAFSTTAAQFEIDAAAYHAAVARNGGKPPVCKRK